MKQFPVPPSYRLIAAVVCLCVMLAAGRPARAEDPPSPAANSQISSSSVPKADDPKAPAPVKPSRDNRPSRFERRAFRNTLLDQKAIWTSPTRFRPKDMKWFAPLGAITGLSFAYDPEISHRFVNRGTHVQRFQTLSTVGVVGLIGVGAGMYLHGVRTGDDRMRETAVLSAEAVAGSMAFGTALKYSLQRERPGVGSGQGDFFATTASPSFPSEHSLIAWSTASVIAHEYPGWATKVGVYGLASAVSLARVAGDKHYASDVLVGSAAGWLIGRYAYKAHHERDLDVLNYGDFDPSPTGKDNPAPPEIGSGMLPYEQGSTYVPLDSWIYPALRRLAALGYIPTQTADMMPWTRTECLRQVHEAESLLNDDAMLDVAGEQPEQAQQLIDRLKREFSELAEGQYEPNYRSLTLESVYTRVGGIVGPPLRDGFNFGQTVVNDFGRPYGEGFNAITGFSARGKSGRFAFYFRGEYQHAAANPALPDAARNFIHVFDEAPYPPAVPFPQTDRARINEAYVNAYFSNIDLTVGKQALYWGPSVGMGAWSYSDNAEPIYMLRFNNRRAIHLPVLGEMRAEFFFGKLSGHLNPARPLLHGQKITLKPTKDLEFGFSRTVEFGGNGRQPLTLGSFWTSFSSVGDNPLADLPGHDPGDRRGGFDFSYRLPKLHKWGATLYGDGLTDDDPSPLGYGAPPRTAWLGGLYLAQVPSLSKLDLHLEGGNSSFDVRSPGHFTYFNSVYKDGYVNNKNLIGNWVGRQGVGFFASSSYWLSPASRLQVEYRRLKQDARFLPGGGTQNDLALRTQLRVRPDLELSGYVQYERWWLPILSPQRNSDWSSAVQITIYPQKALWRSRISRSNKAD